MLYTGQQSDKFETMNYTRHYNLLIEKATKRNWSKDICYVERHHIIPRCLGGSNSRENLVSLTPEEHFVAHLLLAKIYPDNTKLLCAVIRLTGKGNKHRKCTNKISGHLRRKHAENMRNMLVGVPKTKEHVEKVRAALIGRVVPKEEIEKQVATKRKNGSYVVSESAKEKRKLNRQLQSHIHNVPICVFNINYDSIKSAREALNVGRVFIINRLLSEKYPDCYYL
jgi:hypothetical protein